MSAPVQVLAALARVPQVPVPQAQVPQVQPLGPVLAARLRALVPERAQVLAPEEASA